jgi:hypothetical protein
MKSCPTYFATVLPYLFRNRRIRNGILPYLFRNSCPTYFATGQKATLANEYRGADHFSRFAILPINTPFSYYRKTPSETRSQKRAAVSRKTQFGASPTWDANGSRRI